MYNDFNFGDHMADEKKGREITNVSFSKISTYEKFAKFFTQLTYEEFGTMKEFAERRQRELENEAQAIRELMDKISEANLPRSALGKLQGELKTLIKGLQPVKKPAKPKEETIIPLKDIRYAYQMPDSGKYWFWSGRGRIPNIFEKLKSDNDGSLEKFKATKKDLEAYAKIYGLDLDDTSDPEESKDEVA